MNGEKLIRAFDVGVRLGYSTTTIKNWAKQGKLPGAVFIGGHVRFVPHKIEEFIQRGGTPALGISDRETAPRRKAAEEIQQAEDSFTTKRLGPRCEHRWMEGVNVTPIHPYSPDMKQIS